MDKILDSFHFSYAFKELLRQLDFVHVSITTLTRINISTWIECFPIVHDFDLIKFCKLIGLVDIDFDKFYQEKKK